MPDTLLGGIAINEILVDPNGAVNYDTDGNGTAAATDEFIELVNTSTTAIDISGLEIWDAGVGNVFTFPTGTILQPGARALVMTGVQSGGSLPTGGGANDLAFDIGRASAYINNGGDNVVIYDPTIDEFIQATFNGDTLDDPTAGAGGYSGFSSTATRSGSGENFGNDTDGESLQRVYDTSDTFVSGTPTPADANVCFCDGTLLRTPGGTIKVEDVKPGDHLVTADHGIQQVKWVHFRRWTPSAMRLKPNLAPIRIRAGALGENLPDHDLHLSQQHRVLVEGPIARRMFAQDEVLVAAKHLCTLEGVDIVVPARPIAYYHVMLARHEVLIANNVRSESLYLGQQVVSTLSDPAIDELRALLNLRKIDLDSHLPKPARHFAHGKRARRLIDRHNKNEKPVQRCQTVFKSASAQNHGAPTPAPMK